MASAALQPPDCRSGRSSKRVTIYPDGLKSGGMLFGLRADTALALELCPLAALIACFTWNTALKPA